MVLPVDPVWLIFGTAVVLFTAWMLYEHRQTNRKFRLEQDAQASVLAHLTDCAPVDHQHAYALPDHVHPYAAAVHEHEYAPLSHDHTGGTPGHVHWMRYTSTEVTDTKRRDVYVCLVPDCKFIVAHNPEA